MNYKKFLEAASAALMVVIVTLLLAPGAWGQGNFKTLHRFSVKDGEYPLGRLISDAAGNLYGETEIGGKYKDCYFGTCGTVFELSPNVSGTWTTQVIHDFNGSDGTDPYGELIFDAAGNLYGMANRGGADGDGTVFELTPQASGGWTMSVLRSFSGGDGQWPGGGLSFDASGNLYGTTGWGCGMGCVFEMTPNSGGTWTESVLHGFQFEGKSGSYPSGGSLIFDAAGNIYGTGAFGGKSGCSPYGNGCYGFGVVFELSPNGNGTWTEKVLHTFQGKDGESPTCTLVFDAAGNLYGTAFAGGDLSLCSGYGCGVVFELTPNAGGGWTEHVLHKFTGGKDGGVPFAGVIFDAAGNLYGTTTKGGAHNYGVVFKLTPNSNGGWHETVLHAFDNTPGAYPWAGVILDAAGNLYGTTQGDGTKTFGSVFEITP